MSDESTPATGLSAHRIEALTDGIYAVAMTLLVIDLKLPEHLRGGGAELQQALVVLLPRFVAWAMSFFVLALFWIGHHRVYAHVRRTDTRLVWLNIWQLAFVSLMPFCCDMLGEHGGALVSQFLYSANMAALGVFAWLVMRHIRLHPELSVAPIDEGAYRAARLRIGGLIVISAFALLIATVTPFPGAGDFAFMLMAVISPLSRRLERKAAPAAA